MQTLQPRRNFNRVVKYAWFDPVPPGPLGDIQRLIGPFERGRQPLRILAQTDAEAGGNRQLLTAFADSKRMTFQDAAQRFGNASCGSLFTVRQQQQNSSPPLRQAMSS